MHSPRGAALLSLLIATALAAVPPAVSTGAPAKASKAAPPTKSLLDGLELFGVGPTHSPIEFSIGWMGLSKVRGAFSDFGGTIAFDRNDLTRSSVTLVIRTKSLTTFHERRDRDLKSADWFDVEKFPTAVFASREIVKQGDGYLMRGSLTLHGVTKDVEIPFTFNGRLKDAGGDDRIGFEGRTALDRKDFGIVGPARFNAITELGKLMVGDEVDLPLAVEAIHQAPKDTLPDRAADSLWRAIVARGAAPVAKQYRDLRATTADSLMPVNEPRLNAVGAQLLEQGRPADALEVFKLQAEQFPQSASGLTSMAWAYAILGDRQNAIANAEKAAAMNPSATRALEILRRTRAGASN
jgi:polyisoprenoid-binding protein YceI